MVASSATFAGGWTFSSIKTSLMRPLMMLALTGVNDLDHRTTPEAVKISKLSNILEMWKKVAGKVRRNMTEIQYLGIRCQCSKSYLFHRIHLHSLSSSLRFHVVWLRCLFDEDTIYHETAIF